MDDRGRLAQQMTGTARWRRRAADRAAGPAGPGSGLRACSPGFAWRRPWTAGRGCSGRTCRAASGSTPPPSSSRRASSMVSVKGGHIPPVVAAMQEVRDRLGNAAGLPYRIDRAFRSSSRQSGGSARGRRRHRHDVAGFPRCRCGARAAQVQSLDRRRDGAQVLPRYAANRDQGTCRLCAVAEGRSRLRHRR